MSQITLYHSTGLPIVSPGKVYEDCNESQLAVGSSSMSTPPHDIDPSILMSPNPYMRDEVPRVMSMTSVSMGRGGGTWMFFARICVKV